MHKCNNEYDEEDMVVKMVCFSIEWQRYLEGFSEVVSQKAVKEVTLN